MAGTPTEPPAGDSAAGLRVDQQAWARPVPDRWAPSPAAGASGGGPLQDAVSRPPRAEPVGPVNQTVMRTAPGESPA